MVFWAGEPEGDAEGLDLESNWFLMASKFLPENVLEMTVFWVEWEWEWEWEPSLEEEVEVDVVDFFCSKMEIRSDRGRCPAWLTRMDMLNDSVGYLFAAKN